MPNTQNTHQLNAGDPASGYSPRLCNEDLAPTREQNWNWYNIFLSGCRTCIAWEAM